MIESTSDQVVVQGLSKRFGRGKSAVLAVDDLSFSLTPGRITGFLGPNGAGKTTTLRCMLGLVKPTAGTALINGQPYTHLPHPARTIGAVLEAAGLHPARSAVDHLRIRSAVLFGSTKGKQIDEVLDFVGLADAKKRKAGKYSLGMKQRLNLAMAILGDPKILIMDEPTNGLDPAGIKWLRNFLRDYANQGKTVLVSSHLLNEVKQSVDDVVILRRGRMVRYGPLDTIIDGQGPSPVTVSGPDLREFTAALQQRGIAVRPLESAVHHYERPPEQRIQVTGLDSLSVGKIIHETNTLVSELAADQAGADLEQIFLSLTSDDPESEPATEAPPATGQNGATS